MALRARRLVVAVPLAVLAAPPDDEGAIHFEPSLGAKALPIGKLATGNVVRVVFLFRKAFWRDARTVRTRHGQALRRLAFVHAPGAPIMTWWTPYPIDAPLLTAWAGGPTADALFSLGPRRAEREPAIVDAAMDSLAHVFGVRRALVESEIDGWFWHDWSADPFARGAYSYPLVGGATAGRGLGRPIDATIFFAGEATALPPDNGTVHGAIASGYRAARELLASWDQ